MPLDRHRVVRLIELADLERRLTGLERVQREEEVALFIKAAYDDASDGARAEFVTRGKQMLVSAWPWSAVAASGSRPPLALVLLRGQAESADIDPGNRIPDRGRPEAALWAPLHAALDSWDTATIRRWATPRGWLAPAARVPVMMTRPPSGSPQLGVGVGRQPGGGGGVRPGPGNGLPPGNGGVAPPGTGSPPPGGGGVQPGNGGVTPPQDGGIQPVDSSGQSSVTWRHPAVIAAGATVLTTLGVALYSLGRSRGRALPPPPPSGPAVTEAPKP
ncbi:MAG: hypothetical protein JNL82_36390 [Myxococcales bacterium]|nr:hypothetical protein [Myxococcales bacterium]